MAELTKDIRDELRAALQRVGEPKEVIAIIKRVTDSEQLRAALASLGVTNEVISLLQGYRTTLTDANIIEALESLTAVPE